MLLRFSASLPRSSGQQNTRLVTVPRDAFALPVEFREGHFGVCISFLHGHPEQSYGHCQFRFTPPVAQVLLRLPVFLLAIIGGRS
jgi:hypothetical protein